MRRNPRLWAHMVLLSVLATMALIAATRITIPNHIGSLQTLRAQYPATINQAQAGEILNKLAWQYRAEGFGLLRKDGGNNCPIPGSPVRVSCDWIVHLPSGQGCDVFGDGPDADNNGPARPTWCDGESFDTSRFVAPNNPGEPPTPPIPPPTDPPLPPDLELQQRVAKLETDLAQAVAHIGVLDSRIAQLQATSIDESRANQIVGNVLNNVVAVGGTGRTFGHTHTINVQLKPK